MPVYHDTENAVLALFQPGTKVNYNGRTYTISTAGKPQASGSGEGKTDCYVGCTDGTEFKISIKQDNADFLDNKISAQRAEVLFGSNWGDILGSVVDRLSQRFARRQLIYPDANGRTEAGSITLGWRCDIMNKPSGELSEPLTTDTRIKGEILSGENLPSDKRDSYVNGSRIPNSGIANLFWEQRGSFPATPEEFLNQCQTIAAAAAAAGDLYIAAKAVNYRLLCEKYDGNRPLLVPIRWEAVNGSLVPELILNEPLLHGATEMAEKLQNALRTLDVSSIEDLRKCC